MLLEANLFPAWCYDPKTRQILDANDRALRQYGYTRQQFLALRLTDLDAMPSAPEREAAGAAANIRYHRKADGAMLAVRLETASLHVDGHDVFLASAVDLGEAGQALAESESRYRALAESEQRYRQLFEAASDWFWETDTGNRMTYVSPNVEAVLGLPVSSYIGKRLSETEGVVIDREAAKTSLAAIRARQPYRDFIYSRKLPNGKTVWINSTGTPFYAPDGRFLGYRGIARDITPQIEAETALRESEQQFRKVLDASADFHWENDAHYRYLYLSPAFEELLGVPVAEMIGKRLTDVPGVSIDIEMGRLVMRAQAARKPYRDFVYSRQMPDGRKRWFKSSGAPKFDRNGVFQGFRGVSAEITQRVEADALARLSQQRLHEAMAHVAQPIAVYDAEDRIVAFNQVFFDLHRAENGEYVRAVEGISFREIAEWQLSHGFYASGPDDPAVDLETLLARYQTEAEHTYHLRDGRWMLVVYRRLPDGARVGLWTDITAIKQAEAARRDLESQLHHSERLRALGTLAGGAAHEINNALVPVIALTKIVAGKLPDGSRERRNLDTVVTGAERSRDLVKQILAFSRNEEERRRESVDLGCVLGEALRLVLPTLPATIRVEQDIAPAPAIIGDPGQLQQVIVNIMNNAAQAIGTAQGSITVGLAPVPDRSELCLSIADSGCGMDERTMSRIFEPFFTTKEVGEGTGLGLSVAHGIIKAHGGRIEVKSAPNQGSCFDIVLPVSESAVGRAA